MIIGCILIDIDSEYNQVTHLCHNLNTSYYNTLKKMSLVAPLNNLLLSWFLSNLFRPARLYP